jgi:GntR family transcriptional regulator
MTTEERPSYRAVADRLREAIRSGEYAPGSTLPTDTQLAEMHGCNRSTVAKALAELATDGLIMKALHQRGAVVSQIREKITRDATSRYQRGQREEVGPDGQPARGAAGAELARLGLISKSETAVYRGTPPPHVAELLGVSAEGETVVVRARKMLAATGPDDRGMPTQLADTFIPGDLAFGTVLEQENTGAGGMISRLADLGHAQVAIAEEIDVRSPTPEEAASLGISGEQNVFEILHIASAADGRVVEVTRHVMPKGLWRLRYSWPLDQT